MNAQAVIDVARQNAGAVKEGQEKLEGILLRSAKDREFRSKLLSDPRAAVAEHTGRELPENYDIRFIENHGSATIVLPDAIDPKAELSDAELEAVAGGATPLVVATLALGAEVVTVIAMAVASD